MPEHQRTPDPMQASAATHSIMSTTTQQIAVIDYHMGNLRSVSKAIEHVAGDDVHVVVTNDAHTIANADRVVFPGQGAARDCMIEINHLHLADCIREVISTRPFLGICMGMQVLLDGSDESPDSPCLGVLKGRVRRLPNGEDTLGNALTIPQMGWNQVRQRIAHPLWQGIADDERFYFMNSYYSAPEDDAVIAATTPYGIDFVSAMAHGSLFATQFHPEKSQRAGLQLLKNFVSWDGRL
ncbi:MAG: glutamine amidotransferase [Gammaproteobacteria bacterium]